jgi:hypothetical protein
MAKEDLIQKIMLEKSVFVDLGSTITNQELLKPSKEHKYSIYQIGQKAIVLPVIEAERSALVMPYETTIEDNSVRIGELLKERGVGCLNCMTYIQGNHAGRLDFSHCMEFVLADEAKILAATRENSIKLYGEDIFNVTAVDITSRLIGDAQVYAAYLLG